MRALGFFFSASAYWALLPLVARDQIGGGPGLYGLLLGAIGTAAVLGAFLLPFLTHRLGADRMVVAGTLGTVAALVLFGIAKLPVIALVASFAAGVSWIAVIATINVSAQMALPAWVRGRGLSLFATVMFGGTYSRQHRVGPTCSCAGPSGHALRGGLLPRREHPAAAALELSGQPRRRFKSVDALASARGRRGHRGGSGARTCHG